MTDPIIITSAALTAYNHASNIIKSLFELKIDDSLREKLSVLNNEIVTMYESNSSFREQVQSLQAEKDNLTKEIAKFDTWEEQKKRYKLYSILGSVFVYAITEASSNGEPPHWLCTKCFEERKRSFLNIRRTKDSIYDELFCHCGYVITFRGTHKIKYCPE